VSFVGKRVLAVLIFTCLCATVALFVAGREQQIAPPLIEVTELAPREVEPGDRLEVHGSGFPQGRSARVTFSGTVFRPGEPPVRGLSLETSGIVKAPDMLEVSVRESFAEALCGRGDRAAHATFRGDVEISFASSTAGAPPLTGVFRGAVLDVTPSSVRASVLEARTAEGRRLLDFFGVVPGTPTPRGIPIEQVRKGSLADRFGLQVGDAIVSVDGVNVLSIGDVLPASARSCEMVIRHADSGIEDNKTIPLLEFAGERVPTEYAPALVVVGLAIAVLALLVMPGPPSLAALEMRIAARVRRTTARKIVAALVGSGRHAALSAILSAVVAAFALTPYVVGPEMDGVILVAAASSMLVWSRVAVERNALASLRALVRTATVVLVIAATMALVVAHVGAIELSEIVRSQGALPWEFAAARHPAIAILALVYGASIVAVLRTRSPAPVEVALGELPRPSRAALPAHAGLLERAAVLLAAALGVAAFLGGWRLTGSATRGALVAGAGVYVLKTWVVSALLFGAGRVAPAFGPRELSRFVGTRLVVGLVVATALVAASRRLVPSAPVETAFGATVVSLVVIFLVRLGARVRSAVSRPEPHASPLL
jgi:NADH-quinone oxidoreductase subunit H